MKLFCFLKLLVTDSLTWFRKASAQRCSIEPVTVW
ncbi:hypothetical protein BDE02_13G061100 [Populus trichocarpa]|nr:hypothetical protein BDE02_13G061100 [Populus trichocarpa]